MKIDIAPRTFHFKQPAGTSRGIYTTRKSWFVTITSDKYPGRKGVGECAPLPDLSCDASPDYEKTLRAICNIIEAKGEIDYQMLRPYPSMLFGIETAMLNLERGSYMLFNTPFGNGKEGIPFNGLVWMGNFDEMLSRLHDKIKQGFKCVKLKIGAIDFNKEMELVKEIRRNFTKDQIELRVDANGGFTPDNVLSHIETLARYDIHSIEQPIRQHQWKQMTTICKESPLPVALDEELIGVNIKAMKEELLETIKPHYIVLKPSLHGGMQGTREWIDMANSHNIKSWITSALESNIGLNAIAHLTADIYGSGITFPQGLGTGQLFTDNIDMPITIKDNAIWFLKNS